MKNQLISTQLKKLYVSKYGNDPKLSRRVWSEFFNSLGPDLDNVVEFAHDVQTMTDDDLLSMGDLSEIS